LLLLALAGAPDPDESVTVGGRLALEWSAPDGCPDEHEIRSAIDRYLGRDDFDGALDDVRISGSAALTPRGTWQLTTAVTLPGAVVDRAVEANQCADLANAAGLMIAVALDPLRVSQQVVPVQELESVPPALTVEEVAQVEEESKGEAATSTPSMDRVRAFSLELRAGAAGEIGTTPKLRGGTWLAFAIVLQHVRVEVSGQWWFPRAIRPFPESPGAGASIQMGGAAVRTCYVPRVRRLELPACLAFEGGLLRARGIGLDEARVSRRPWLAFVAGQELVFMAWRGFGVWLALDAVVNLMRPRFFVEDLGPVLTPGIVSFRFMGGPAVRF
jgi:hypothetical protein